MQCRWPRRRLVTLLASTVVFVFSAAVHRHESVLSAQEPVTVVDLTPQLGRPSVARAINDVETIVGTHYTDDFAFIWPTGGDLRSLEMGVPLAINNRDEAVGHRGGSAPFVGVLWRDGEATAIALGDAYAISDAGTIVGYHYPPHGVYHAFRWTQRGGLEDVESLTSGLPPWSYWSEAFSEAHAVRADGVMAGRQNRDAVTWAADGTRTSFGPGVIYAISEASVAVGAVPLVNGSPTAWRDGQAIPLTAAVGAALAVNESGYVVGWMIIAGERHAFTWHEALGLQDLGPGIALGINEAGHVVGARRIGGVDQATLWRLPLRVEDHFTALSALATRLLADVDSHQAVRVSASITEARAAWVGGDAHKSRVRLRQGVQAVSALDRRRALTPNRASALRDLFSTLIDRL